MIPQFEGLSEAQKELMYDAIPLITVYIAGADGKIDKEETEWAEKITKIRSYSYHPTLQTYYTNVGEKYADKLSHYMNTLPSDTKERTAAIHEQLAGLNSILAGLDVNFAGRFYNSLVTFAKHVAKASGGFLGMGSISRSEARLIDLDMLTPIVFEEDEEVADEGNDDA